VLFTGFLFLKKHRLPAAMKRYKTTKIAVYAGITAVVIGLVAFTLSWNLWDFWSGPMPGLQFLLFPGNLTLVYIWHPLFTEEVNFWPKLALLLLGQFIVVSLFVGLLAHIVKKLRTHVS
jgi:hypothetical protein